MLASFAGGAVLLAVLPYNHPNIADDPCLATAYLGTYGTQSVFLPQTSCYADDGPAKLHLAGLGPSEPELLAEIQDGDELVWVEEASIDDNLLRGPWPSILGIDDYLGIGIPEPVQAELELEQQSQDVLSAPANNAYSILYRDEHSALLTLPAHHAYRLSDVLPPTWRIYALPREPLLLSPVPDSSIQRVIEILDNFHFDPLVARTVDAISIAQMKKDARWLTGEDPHSPIVSRHSFNEGSRLAADWIKDTIEGTGATCELRPFLIGFAPNVICRYPSTVNTTATVLISGHYDSRGTFGSPRAPGANDDGSGTTGILSIARAIKHSGVAFKSNVELVTFAGEEQGLYGSYYYSKELQEEKKDLVLMIQADMTGYHVPGEPMQLGLPQSIGTPEVAALISKAAETYSPELRVGFSSACCSDHQSFLQHGFPASQVFERAGPIADPMYHNSDDLSNRDGYDFDQMKGIAKVQFATLLHAAGFELKDES